MEVHQGCFDVLLKKSNSIVDLAFRLSDFDILTSTCIVVTIKIVFFLSGIDHVRFYHF